MAFSIRPLDAPLGAEVIGFDLAVDKDLFDLNVFSVVALSRVVMPHFHERGEGTFAIMSSSAGKTGVPFSGTYTGSKHALHVRILVHS